MPLQGLGGHPDSAVSCLCKDWEVHWQQGYNPDSAVSCFGQYLGDCSAQGYDHQITQYHVVVRIVRLQSTKALTHSTVGVLCQP